MGCLWVLLACQMACPCWGQARLHDDPLGPSSWAPPPLGLASMMEFLSPGPAQYPTPHTLIFFSFSSDQHGLSSVQPAAKLPWFKAKIMSTYEGMQSKGVNTCPEKDWLVGTASPQFGSLIRKKGRGCQRDIRWVSIGCLWERVACES